MHEQKQQHVGRPDAGSDLALLGSGGSIGKSTSGSVSAQADTHRLKHGAVMTLDSCDIDLDMHLFIM